MRRHGCARALVVGLAVAMGAGPARAAEPGAASEAPMREASGGEAARASLVVDVAEVGASGPVLLQRIEELGDIELRRAEILPGRSTVDPVIHVRVKALAEGGYVIESYLADPGGVVEGSERSLPCNLCTEGETVERARGEVVRLAPFVRGLAAARGEPGDAGAGGLSPRGLGTRTKVGIAVVAAGAVGVGVGLGLALREPTPRPEMPLETVDTRVPGYVALGVGGALVVTGVILALRGRASPGRGRVGAAIGPQGVVLGGRF